MDGSPIQVEAFFEALISGEREAARGIVERHLEQGVRPAQIAESLFWPALAMVDHLYRHDQLAAMSHHYATRLLRMLTGQLQLRFEAGAPRDKQVLLIGGPDEVGELAGQMAADLLEADGYNVYFAGGGVARDEILAQVGQLQPDVLVMFGSGPADLPYIRQAIDQLHDIGACPRLQIAVGGGVFSRAEGLAQEIGADLWAHSPNDLVRELNRHPQRRATPDQRTVGRSLRAGGKRISAA